MDIGRRWWAVGSVAFLYFALVGLIAHRTLAGERNIDWPEHENMDCIKCCTDAGSTTSTTTPPTHVDPPCAPARITLSAPHCKKTKVKRDGSVWGRDCRMDWVQP